MHVLAARPGTGGSSDSTQNVNAMISFIADAIRDKTGGTDPLTLDGLLFAAFHRFPYETFFPVFIDRVERKMGVWNLSEPSGLCAIRSPWTSLPVRTAGAGGKRAGHRGPEQAG